MIISLVISIPDDSSVNDLHDAIQDSSSSACWMIMNKGIPVIDDNVDIESTFPKNNYTLFRSE